MQPYMRFIVGGFLIAAVGFALVLVGLSGWEASPPLLFVGGLLVGVGATRALIGTIGWGVFLGSQGPETDGTTPGGSGPRSRHLPGT